MKGSVKLVRIFGIDIKLHFSWWFIFALLAWALSSNFFPAVCSGEFKGLTLNCSGFTAATYWFMGISASLLLFVSVLLHELSHSLVAKAKKIKVESITLFFFGGVAGIGDEDMKPMSELQMALAGPIFSLFLAGVFFLIFKFNGNAVLTGIMFYLYYLNLILAAFNMVPAFPLDGGRAFRAILRMYYKDLKKATKIAVTGGKIFAGFLIFMGIFGLITGIVNGLWFIFLGGFLYFIAGMSYEQVVVKETLSKIPVKELIEKKYLSVSPASTLGQLIKDHPSSIQEGAVVKKNGIFVGILDLKKIKTIPSNKTKVSQLLTPKNKIQTVDFKSDSYKAFSSMLKQKLDILPVMEKNTIKGIISRRNLMNRLVLELKFGASSNHTSIKKTAKKIKK